MTILDLKSFLRLHLNSRPSFICALDIGTKSTGIAISDLSWFITARPLGKVYTETFIKDFNKLLVQNGIRKEKISGYVVGMPYHHHHSYKDKDKEKEKKNQCDVVKEITLNLQLEKPIVFIDERLTTAHAKQQYLLQQQNGNDLNKFQKKRDELAAVLILQRFQSQSKILLREEKE